MDYDRIQKTVYLEGPGEIIPVLHALGDLSARTNSFTPDDLIEVPVDQAWEAYRRLDARSSRPGASLEDRALRDITDTLGITLMRGGTAPISVQEAS